MKIIVEAETDDERARMAEWPEVKDGAWIVPGVIEFALVGRRKQQPFPGDFPVRRNVLVEPHALIGRLYEAIENIRHHVWIRDNGQHSK